VIEVTVLMSTGEIWMKTGGEAIAQWGKFLDLVGSLQPNTSPGFPVHERKLNDR
jgi:hypothetical protein